MTATAAAAAAAATSTTSLTATSFFSSPTSIAPVIQSRTQRRETATQMGAVLRDINKDIKENNQDDDEEDVDEEDEEEEDEDDEITMQQSKRLSEVVRHRQKKQDQVFQTVSQKAAPHQRKKRDKRKKKQTSMQHKLQQNKNETKNSSPSLSSGTHLSIASQSITAGALLRFASEILSPNHLNVTPTASLARTRQQSVFNKNVPQSTSSSTPHQSLNSKVNTKSNSNPGNVNTSSLSSFTTNTSNNSILKWPDLSPTPSSLMSPTTPSNAASNAASTSVLPTTISFRRYRETLISEFGSNVYDLHSKRLKDAYVVSSTSEANDVIERVDGFDVWYDNTRAAKNVAREGSNYIEAVCNIYTTWSHDLSALYLKHEFKELQKKIIKIETNENVGATSGTRALPRKYKKKEKKNSNKKGSNNDIKMVTLQRGAQAMFHMLTYEKSTSIEIIRDVIAEKYHKHLVSSRIHLKKTFHRLDKESKESSKKLKEAHTQWQLSLKHLTDAEKDSSTIVEQLTEHSMYIRETSLEKQLSISKKELIIDLNISFKDRKGEGKYSKANAVPQNVVCNYR